MLLCHSRLVHTYLYMHPENHYYIKLHFNNNQMFVSMAYDSYAQVGQNPPE